jgi:hypothetical protein
VAIIGTHMLFYTPETDALRATLRDVFGLKHVDAGHGWLIFALPPAELGVHPSDASSAIRHQITFMCDDIQRTVADLKARGIQFEGEPEAASFGTTIMMTLPGDLQVMLYEPRHAMAITPATG